MSTDVIEMDSLMEYSIAAFELRNWLIENQNDFNSVEYARKLNHLIKLYKKI